MADFKLKKVPFLNGFDRQYGDTRLHERTDLMLTSMAVPQGGEAAFAAALKSATGLDLPTPRVASQRDNLILIATTPDQFLLISPDGDAPAEALAGAAYVTDQSDVWVALEISGTGARRALERICPIDLDESVFQTGAFARTVMEHLGAFILRRDADAFLLLSASSSARSFLHTVETSIEFTT